MSDVKILYNNQDVFLGIAPTPIISISNEILDYGSKWNQVTSMSLEGQLTGKYLGTFSYISLNDSVRKLHSGFNSNYKTLIVQENGGILYSGDNVVVESIDIEDGTWYGVIPFTINLSIYDSGFFQDYYGIVEPTQNFSFEEEAGDILNFTHNISAKGIVAKNKNAIQNAKEWVLSKTGDINLISPLFISKARNFNNRPYLLQSSKELIDRFNGTYSWEGIYKKSINSENPNNCFLNYTIDLNSGIDDGYITTNINGSLEGNNLAILRQEYNQLDLYNLCSNAALDIFNTSLSNRALSQSVDETSGENKLNFKSSYNNDYSDEIINNYTVDINENSLTCIRTVNFSSTLSCRYGDIKTKWDKIYSFYKNKFYPFSLARTEFLKEFPSAVLNETPVSESINFDEFNAKITYSAEYTDKKISFSSDLQNLSSSVSYIPAINIYAPNTSAFTIREHNVQNLNCANRSKIDISVTAVAKINKNISIAESECFKEINRIKNNYLQGGIPVLEDRRISRNQDLKSVTIDETWTFNGAIIS